MTRSTLLVATLLYCCAVFGAVYIVKNVVHIPAPFDWLVSLVVSWVLLGAYYKSFYFPKKGYNLQLGFQAFNPQEQLAAFALMLAVPMLATFAFIFGLEIRITLFAVAFALSAGLAIFGHEVKIRSEYTNINEKSPPILKIYYSRTKAWVMLLIATLLVIAPMTVLFILAYRHSGFQPVLLLPPAFAIFIAWISRRYVQRLRHTSPVITISPLYISYDAPNKPSKVIDWNNIKELSWFADKSNKLLIINTINQGEVVLQVSGLELEPAAIHALLVKYYNDYVHNNFSPQNSFGL
ncbi:MAG: hypothetical protein IPN33_17185 [Saprospiraceae bacterium]|nr:hypothetical protein [Saprospiraceae bacterium]